VELLVSFLADVCGSTLLKKKNNKSERGSQRLLHHRQPIAEECGRKSQERKKERTKMFHDLKRPVTIHSMDGQNKKFVRYSLRPSLSSAVLSFEFWRRICAHLVCFFLFCFFFSCLGFFLFLLLLLLSLFLFFLLLLVLGFFPKFVVKEFFFLVL